MPDKQRSPGIRNWFVFYLCQYICEGANQVSTLVANDLLSWAVDLYSFASLNYLSPFLTPNCSTPVGQMGLEAGSHCRNKIGSVVCWGACEIAFQYEGHIFRRSCCCTVFPIDHTTKDPQQGFFFRIYNNFVQQQRSIERKSINCALSPSRPSAQVPESQ